MLIIVHVLDERIEVLHQIIKIIKKNYKSFYFWAILDFNILIALNLLKCRNLK